MLQETRFVTCTRYASDGRMRTAHTFPVDRESWLGRCFYGQGAAVALMIHEASGDVVEYELVTALDRDEVTS